MTRSSDLGRRIFGRMARTAGPDVEHMRVGGLPAADHWPRSPETHLRGLIDDGPRGNLSVNFPPVRTCSCGAMVERGSPADAFHTRECGPEPEPAEPEEIVTTVTAECERCGQQIAAGATYCSVRCRTLARRASDPGTG
jgi:hypothetical protein